MQTITQQHFEGERPLFASHDLILNEVSIGTGESALKECNNITALHCTFDGKYPFWHNHGFNIKNCLFKPGARAALWYADNLLMSDTVVDAPKMFRKMDNLKLTKVKLNDAQETLWDCQNIELDEVEVKNGDYLLMHSNNIKVSNFKLDGNYAFQSCRNVIIKNATLNTKDSFWESENVTVYDSTINGEYIGWHSVNLRLVNCHISGTQPLCYAKNLVLENCTFAQDADLAFEYSSVQAQINSTITSVKNPLSGKIIATGYGQIILDKNLKAPGNCIITTYDQEHQSV